MISAFQIYQYRSPNKFSVRAMRKRNHRVISGIIHVVRNGLMWLDAPSEYGPHKTLCNRFGRWSEVGVFDRIFSKLATECKAPDTVMIDATHLNAHRMAQGDLGIQPCTPGRSNRKEPVKYEQRIYKKRDLIERMLGRLKNWRCITTRYD